MIAGIILALVIVIALTIYDHKQGNIITTFQFVLLAVLFGFPFAVLGYIMEELI